MSLGWMLLSAWVAVVSDSRKLWYADPASGWAMEIGLRIWMDKSAGAIFSVMIENEAS